MTDKRPDKPDYARITITATMMLWIVLLVTLVTNTNLRHDILHTLIVLSVSVFIVYLALSFNGTAKLIEYFSKKEKLNRKLTKLETLWFVAFAVTSLFKDMIEYPLQVVVLGVGLMYLLFNWVFGKHLTRH